MIDLKIRLERQGMSGLSAEELKELESAEKSAQMDDLLKQHIVGFLANDGYYTNSEGHKWFTMNEIFKYVQGFPSCKDLTKDEFEKKLYAFIDEPHIVQRGHGFGVR
jgi:hypothetical protein